jgi:haloalkane dehalogenase
MNHDRNVRALAFFETIVKSMRWRDFSRDFKLALRLFRTPGLGRLLIQGLNLFVKQALPRGVTVRLDPAAKEMYEQPFGSFSSRKPLWRMPNDLPLDGRPSDVSEAADQWAAWLGRSAAPKLLIHASPGLLIRSTEVAWCKANIRNLATIDIGGGLHYLQEEQPEAIGNAIAQWLRSEVIETDPVSR